MDERLTYFHNGTVIPAMPLALDENRKHDARSQRASLRYYLDAGAGGVAVGVHSTQFAIREKGMYAGVLAFAADEIGGYEKRTGAIKLKIAGVCGRTEQALAEAETAKKLGYDYVLLSPGALEDVSEEYLLDRTESVAKILPVIGFYLQEAVGGRRLGFDYWNGLCEIPGVIGVKCAPFDRYQTVDLMRGAAFSSRRKEIALYTGNDDSIVTDLLTKYRFNVDGKTVEVGFSGGLLGHWGVWTKKAVELLDKIHALREEIPSDLLTLGAQITDCNAAFFDARNGYKGAISGIHEVLRRQGIFKGIWCLDENEKLSPGQSEEIDRVYAMYPQLNDDGFVRENLASWLE